MNYYISDIHFGCQNSYDKRTFLPYMDWTPRTLKEIVTANSK